MTSLYKGLFTLATMFVFSQLFIFIPQASADINDDCTYVLSNNKKSIKESCDYEIGKGSVFWKGTATFTKTSLNKYTLTEKTDAGLACKATIDIGTVGGYTRAKLSGTRVDDLQCQPIGSNTPGININRTAANNSIRDTATNGVLRSKLTGLVQDKCKGLGSADAISSCNSRNLTSIDTCGKTAFNSANRTAGTGGSESDASAVYIGNITPCIANATGISSAAVKKALGPNIYAEVSDANENAAVVESGTCKDGQTLDSDGECAEDSSSTCNIDGIGWIICPIFYFMGNLNDAAFGVIKQFLTVETGLLTDTSTEDVWKTFRNIANVLFVIAFMVIIYAQMTGFGVSNYGLKRLLPKLVIAAILVNISFYVCQIAVDISNILGSSIRALFETIPVGSSSSSSGPTTWDGLVKAALIGTGFVALIALVFLAPTVLLAFGLVLLILVARKALIVLLIIVSPLAFVAYLLPNTEKWAKQWWKMFSTLLLLFPIIAVVFGASELASQILLIVAEKGGEGGEQQTLLSIVALSVAAVPLFAVPALLKGSLAAAGSVGQQVAKLQGRANGRALRGMKDGRLGEAKNAFDRNRQNRSFARRRGEGKLAQWGEKNNTSRVGQVAQWAGTRQKSFDESSVGQKLGGTRGAAIATQGIHKQHDEDVSAFKTTMTSQTPAELSTIMNDKKNSAAQRSAAAGLIGQRGGQSDVNQAIDDLGATYASASSPAEKQVIDAIQKQFMADAGSKLPQSMTGPSKGAMSTGQFGGNLSAEILKSLEDGRYSGQSLASMHPRELDKVLSTLSSARASLNASQLSQLTTLQTSIVQYKQAAVTHGKGMSSELEVPLTGIETL